MKGASYCIVAAIAVVIAAANIPRLCRAGTARPATSITDAADLYLRAAKALVVESPGSSNLEYPEYPPFGVAWERLAQTAWEKNEPARQLARAARAVDRASWPVGEDFKFLAGCRELAIGLSDAAIYQHLRGEDADAVEIVRDVLHLGRLLRQNVRNELVRPSVAAGVDDSATRALMIIASDVKLTKQGDDDRRKVSVQSARALIAELLDQQDVEVYLTEILGTAYPLVRHDAEAKPGIERFVQTYRRSQAEKVFAAVSLACQIFRLENDRWPAELAELVPADLPRVPIDPWGDGTQAFGYVVIKDGLAGIAERPLVYSRADSRDGLFYRTDHPHYNRYFGDGSGQPSSKQKRGGQFRDITRWQPPAAKAAPSTRPLP